MWAGRPLVAAMTRPDGERVAPVQRDQDQGAPLGQRGDTGLAALADDEIPPSARARTRRWHRRGGRRCRSGC